jgi:hypothetical protein
MRPAPIDAAERFRLNIGPRECRGTNNGAFKFRRKGVELRVIASDGGGWDHVSVSLPDRCPTWNEMRFIKDIFWGPEEAVMQLHPPQSEYVNCHPFCLHMWKPQNADIPAPPTWMVGIKTEA